MSSLSSMFVIEKQKKKQKISNKQINIKTKIIEIPQKYDDFEEEIIAYNLKKTNDMFQRVENTPQTDVVTLHALEEPPFFKHIFSSLIFIKYKVLILQFYKEDYQALKFLPKNKRYNFTTVSGVITPFLKNLKDELSHLLNKQTKHINPHYASYKLLYETIQEYYNKHDKKYTHKTYLTNFVYNAIFEDSYWSSFVVDNIESYVGEFKQYERKTFTDY
jgi:hypothetical protein